MTWDILFSKDTAEILKLIGGLAGIVSVLFLVIVMGWRIATGNVKFIQFGKVKVQMDENGNPIEKKTSAKRRILPRRKPKA